MSGPRSFAHFLGNENADTAELLRQNPELASDVARLLETFVTLANRAGIPLSALVIRKAVVSADDVVEISFEVPHAR